MFGVLNDSELREGSRRANDSDSPTYGDYPPYS
jgi:hypothetical protein